MSEKQSQPGEPSKSAKGTPMPEETKEKQSMHEDEAAEDNQEEIKDEADEQISYREVSEMSEITQESYPQGYIISQAGNAVEDLVDFDKLKEHTQRKLEILQSEAHEELSEISSSRKEDADEFLRNFFIKFGMARTMDSFQREWFELQTKGELDRDKMPEIPKVYKENIELSNVLTQLQREVDEARIIAEKSRSTYDKLRKQRDFQKINHRRVQQEKQKLNNDIGKLKKRYEDFQGEFDQLSSKYENAIKEKMLMKLEKDRLAAKLENLQSNLGQIKDNDGEGFGLGDGSQLDLQSSPGKTNVSQISKKGSMAKGSPSKMSQASQDPRSKAGTKGAPEQQTKAPLMSVITKDDPPNPYLNEEYEPINPHLSSTKNPPKGHLMGVTSLSYNPKKDILATGSDDTTWKLFTLPEGQLIMSGEGHQDWIGGVSFHPHHHYLATASGDGCVKVWDYANTKCQTTYTEHGQPVWKVDWHHSGDFMISCSMDHSIKLWDIVNTKSSRFTFRGHVDSVNSIQWRPYSNVFVSGSGDKTISLWDIRTNRNGGGCVQTFYGHNNSVNTTRFNLAGDMIVSGDCDGINKVWDIRMVKEVRQFDSGLSSSNCAIFDKSGKYVIVGNELGTITLFNMETAEKEPDIKGHDDAILDLCFDNSKDGSLITASADCSFKIWNS